MKKVLLICIFILLSPILVLADELEITRIELFEQTSSVVINSSPEYDGLSINLDHSFENINDMIKYKIFIKNNQAEDYVLKLASGSSKYISYAISEDVLKGDSENYVILTMTYTNEFKNLTSTFHDKNTIELSFIPKNSTTVTLKAYLPFAIVSFVVYSIIIFTKNKKMWYTSPLLGILLFGIYSFPISFAEKKIDLTSKVHILKSDKCSSFKEDSWKTIIKNISKNETKCYKPGDIKEITINDKEKVNVKLVNLTSPKECSSIDFSTSSCGFIIEFETPLKEVKTLQEANEFINTELYNMLPKELTEVLKKENIFILSLNEIGIKNDLEIKETNTRTLDYYLLESKVYSDKNILVRNTKDDKLIYVDKEQKASLVEENPVLIKPAFKLN